MIKMDCLSIRCIGKISLCSSTICVMMMIYYLRSGEWCTWSSAVIQRWAWDAIHIPQPILAMSSELAV